MSREPVLTAITALVAATLALLVAFGVHLTAAQQGAIVAWVGAAYGVALLIRARVTPVAAAGGGGGRARAGRRGRGSRSRP